MISKMVSNQKYRIDSSKLLVVTGSWCKACGICMALCPQQVLGEDEVTKKVVVVASDLCTGCGRCELACPDYVFSIEELDEAAA